MEELRFANVRLTRDGAVATITLDRPKQLNALDATTLRELARAVRELRREVAVRAVVVAGAGEKVFCAGADIRAMSLMTAVSTAEV